MPWNIILGFLNSYFGNLFGADGNSGLQELMLVLGIETSCDAGLPQHFSSSAAQGSHAPSKARNSEAVGRSDSMAGGRPGGRRLAAEGRMRSKVSKC